MTLKDKTLFDVGLTTTADGTKNDPGCGQSSARGW
jgi:hypothetical protein